MKLYAVFWLLLVFSAVCSAVLTDAELATSPQADPSYDLPLVTSHRIQRTAVCTSAVQCRNAIASSNTLTRVCATFVSASLILATKSFLTDVCGLDLYSATVLAAVVGSAVNGAIQDSLGKAKKKLKRESYGRLK